MPDLADLFDGGDDTECWNRAPEEWVAKEFAEMQRVLARELERMALSEDRLQGDGRFPEDRSYWLYIPHDSPPADEPLLDVERLDRLRGLLSGDLSRWRIALHGGDAERSLALCRDGWGTLTRHGTWDAVDRVALCSELRRIKRAGEELQDEVAAALRKAEKEIRSALASVMASEPPHGMHHLMTLFFEDGDPQGRLDGANESYGDPRPWSVWFVALERTVADAVARIDEVRITERAIGCSYKGVVELDVYRLDDDMELIATGLFECEDVDAGRGIAFRVNASDQAEAIEVRCGDWRQPIRLRREDAKLL